MNQFSLSKDFEGSSGHSLAYDTLAYSIFPVPRPGASTSTVVAFTSANSGEGVTFVARSVMSAMNAISPGRTLLVNMDWLKREPSPRANQANTADGEAKSMAGWEHRKHLIQQMRARSQFVAVDCPALQISSDALSIASLVDGVVLVVEADRTKKTQIRNAERLIESAGGRILGLVLNKRRYLVPEFLYNLL
jgi:Mrp family chromosome partitioning ATPase